MNLVGDPIGLEELKRMKAERKDFLRFLITEARTSFSRSAEFKGSSGRNWRLIFDGQKNELRIEPTDGSTDRVWERRCRRS